MSALSEAILAAGPSAVAFAALWWGSKQQRRGFEHERAMTDLDSVRALLDDAALVAHRADYARYRTRGAIIEHGHQIAVQAPEVIEEVRETGVALDEKTARLAVRLGPEHEAVVAYRELTQAIYAILVEVRRPPQVLDRIDDAFMKVEEASERLDKAQARFLAAAARVAGAKLD